MPIITVPPEGPLDAKIVIVGEAPGMYEEQYRRPFVGPSGELLNQMLVHAGIVRQQCYITNVAKRRPPNNDFSVFYETSRRLVPTEELRSYIRTLEDEIARVHPNVVLLLGSEALRAATGLLGITKYRGSVLYLGGQKYIPTYHPADVLRTFSHKFICEFDIRRAAEESTTRTYTPPPESFITRPTKDQVLAAINTARNSKLVAFDIETVDHHVRCLGLAWSPSEAICIPFMCNPYEWNATTTATATTTTSDLSSLYSTDNYSSYFSESDEREILSALYDLFSDPEVKLLAQNAPFDMTILGMEFGFRFANLYMDTMVAHHCCYSELPKGLDFLASIYTRIPYYSDYSSSSDIQTWVYNCRDCIATYQCAQAIHKNLKALHLEEFYFNHIHPTVIAMCRVDSRGVLIDLNERSAQREVALQKKAELHNKLKQITLERLPDFEPSSPKKVAKYLYEVLRIPAKISRDTGAATTQEDSLKELARSKYGAKCKDFIDTLLEYRGYAKLISTYYDVPVYTNGRIYTHFNVAGTDTGRLSSSSPVLLPGSNLQNAPRGEYRKIIIAREDHVLIKADLSQAELRLVIWLAGIDSLIQAYTSDPKYDIYKRVASMIYNVPESAITKEQRQYGKIAALSGNYGVRERTVALKHNIDVDKAAFILQRYHSSIPEISMKFWPGVQAALRSNRTIVSVTGRRRIFLNRMDDSTFRAAYAHSAQCLVGDLINRAATLFELLYPPEECRILLQVHDELVFECKKGYESIYIPRIKNLMEYELHFPSTPVPLKIPAEITVGPNWFDQKKP